MWATSSRTDPNRDEAALAEMSDNAIDQPAVAVVGMAGRFPGAGDVDALWRLLTAEREGLTRFDRGRLRAAGLPEAMLNDPAYVPVNGALADLELFDADFFDMSPRDARITDPQHRIMLELAWQALEHAGCDPGRYDGSIGVYAGCGHSSYLLHNLLPNVERVREVGQLAIQIGNGNDYLPTRISHRLDLTGPSIAVNTACSTSLVAVHLGMQALLDLHCDMVLAGGAGIQVPQDTGYAYTEGGILSPDGRCRAFDADARGTVSGNGAALVVLKRLEDALADGDRIHAVILGSAVNNDGADKAGYTAPSVTGQARVIAEAQAVAGVTPGEIDYVEAHGTGTPLGDPIEVAALRQAFAADPAAGDLAPGGCAIGSIKTNLGHLDEAAGVAGLIKTVLALSNQQIPASLHYARPNPELGLEASPFRIASRSAPWPAPASGTPRRAGVSSFGIGGTNAHLVLEEAPDQPARPAQRPVQLLPISARSESALTTRACDLSAWFAAAPDASLADAAYTLQVGRRAFALRGFALADGPEEAKAALGNGAGRRAIRADTAAPPVVFLCSGQGSQHPGMAAGLYRYEPVFREAFDDCAQRLRARLPTDLRRLIDAGPDAAAEEQLRRTEIAQPALFAVGYATACLWRSWGVEPTALIGHSLGEYVAACLAGVLDLESALKLVAVRGQAMQATPEGGMLSVRLSAEALAPYLGEGVELAAVNAAELTVASGRIDAIAALADRLNADGHDCQRLPLAQAFHSALMEPALPPFAAELRRHAFAAPRIPYVGNLTGDWMSGVDVAEPETWLEQLRRPVRFAEGLRRILDAHPNAILLEIGPGQALVQAARRNVSDRTLCLPSLPDARRRECDHRVILSTLGTLWQRGIDVDWSAFAEACRHKIPLPTYPFERQRHWIDPPQADAPRNTGTGAPSRAAVEPAELTKRPDVSDWLYEPSWRRLPQRGRAPAAAAPADWLLLADDCGLSTALAERLRTRGARVTLLRPGATFDAAQPQAPRLRPHVAEDWGRLFDRLGDAPTRRIVSLWSLDTASAGDGAAPDLGNDVRTQIALAKALADRPYAAGELILVTRGLDEVTGGETLAPRMAAATGPALVIPQELPGLASRVVDLDAGADDQALLTALDQPAPPRITAVRGRHLWAQTFEPVAAFAADAAYADTNLPSRLRQGGVYLITGGLGRIGLMLAEHLATRAGAALVLTGRTPVPARGAWADATERGDPTAGIVQHLLAIEAAGGSVLTVQADVTNPADMRAARLAAEARFGAIQGVFHCAAVPAAESLREIRRLAPPDVDRQFAVKADGLAVVEAVFAEADHAPDFFMLFSSLAAVLGGIGFSAYAGANAVLDQRARAASNVEGADWISVNWDAWDSDPGRDDAGMLDRQLRAAQITPEEGRRLFDLLLSQGLSGQVVVSTTDLDRRMARWRERPATLQTSRQAGQPAPTDQGLDTPDAGAARPDVGVAYVAPRTPREEIIAAVWRTQLGLAQVGVDDDFFALRGDSLLATQVIGRINRELGTQLTMAALFETPTVAGLATTLEDAAAGHPLPPISKAPAAEDYPLTHGQKRLWILSQDPIGTVAYNLSYSLRLTGALDADALTAAFTDIVAQHESLRTAFVLRGGEPRQCVRPTSGFVLDRLDLAAKPDPVAAARKLVRQEAECPFDLTAPPLLRARLLRLDRHDHVLLISLHHIVADGVSLNVLLRELDQAYSARCRGTAPAFQPLALQYPDVAVWQAAQMAGPTMRAQRSYWLEQLAGDPSPMTLPLDRPRTGTRGYAGANAVVRLEPEAQARLHTLARQQGVTLFTLLAAALDVLLHRVTGAEEIRVGLPVAGREQADLQGQIGYYLNNVVLRERVWRGEPFSQLLQRVRKTVVGAFANQAYPFDCLVDDLSVTPEPGRTPLFDVLLNLMPTQALELRLGDLAVAGFHDGASKTPFDLNVMVSDGAAGLSVEFAYDTALFDATTVQSMADTYARLLETIADAPETTVRDICRTLDATEGGAQAASEKAAFLANALNLNEVF